jgi:hypothetical protein
MKYFSINQLPDKTFSLSKGSYIYIFENIQEYKEEILDIIEDNKNSYIELKYLVESWGGKIDLVPLDLLIKEYIKNKNE